MNIIIKNSQLERLLLTNFENKIVKEQTLNPLVRVNPLLMTNVLKYDSLRDFLYSAEGIATVVGIDAIGGEPISIVLFSILVFQDIITWIENGEPNWIELICDLICVFTGGIASPLVKTISKETNVGLKMIFQKFPQLRNYMGKIIVPVIDRVVGLLSKINKFNFKKLDFLNRFGLKTILDRVFKMNSKIQSKLESLKKIFTTYVKYKTYSFAFEKFMETKTGKDFTNFVMPKINPLLGCDKVPQFLVDLTTKSAEDIYKMLV